MRFNNPKEVQEWAADCAVDAVKRHDTLGHDLNPYSTPGNRHDWQRGFDNAGPRSYESPEIVKYCTSYNRGRETAKLIAMLNRQVTIDTSDPNDKIIVLQPSTPSQ